MASGNYGKLITLEGIDGCGKSTQAALLATALRTLGRDVLVTREPGGSPGAEEIRTLLVTGEPGRWDPVAELMLYCAARREHVARTVLPALKAGTWVVCDRFADSTTAYQRCARGLSAKAVRTLNRIAVGDATPGRPRTPDLTVILDMPAEAALSRARERAGPEGGLRTDEDRFERMDPVFHRRVRDGYLTIANAEPRRCVVVDAAGTVEEVHQAVLGAVRERLAP